MIHVCAAVICLDRKYLLTTRPKGTHLEGKWEFPGGKLRNDETAYDCLVREVHEELGVDILPLDLIYSVQYEYPEKEGVKKTDQLKTELALHVRKEIGPIAKPDKIQFANALTKTRSGKIMRRILKAIAEGKDDVGDTTTLANASVVDNLIKERL